MPTLIIVTATRIRRAPQTRHSGATATSGEDGGPLAKRNYGWPEAKSFRAGRRLRSFPAGMVGGAGRCATIGSSKSANTQALSRTRRRTIPHAAPPARKDGTEPPEFPADPKGLQSLHSGKSAECGRQEHSCSSESADLAPSTKTGLHSTVRRFLAENYTGRNSTSASADSMGAMVTE